MSHLHAPGRTLRGVTPKVGRTIAARSTLRTHREMGRRRSGTVWGTYARIVLRSAPREADARVTDRIALHLIDGHLSCVTVDELNEATTLAGRDLDVGDLAEALEEGAELILGDVARQTANKHGSVVRIRELVHRLLLGHRLRVALAKEGRGTPAHLAHLLLLLRHHRALLTALAVLVGAAHDISISGTRHATITVCRS